jgi:hypothetical protein
MATDSRLVRVLLAASDDIGEEHELDDDDPELLLTPLAGQANTGVRCLESQTFCAASRWPQLPCPQATASQTCWMTLMAA